MLDGMRRPILLCALLAAPLAARAEPAPTATLVDGYPEAAQAILKRAPLIVGFGEYHEKKGAAKVPSAIKRFTHLLLPQLAPRVSDLVVETWVTEGSCGAQEKKVVKRVEKTTQRPESTENEVVTLLQRAKALKVEPHILKVSCKDYKELLAADQVDYEKLLGLITRQLRDAATRLFAKRAAADRMIALYGGALHNDVTPTAGLEAFSYAAALTKLAGGRYLEVDLYVPEYIERDKELRKQAWFPLFQKQASRSKLLLIERGPRSLILIFPRSGR